MQIKDCKEDQKVSSEHNKDVWFYIIIKVNPQTVHLKAPSGLILKEVRPTHLHPYEE